MIKGKRILVAGGAGSIGSELVRQLAPKNKVYVLDINESGLFDTVEPLKTKGFWVVGRVGDIRDIATVREVFEDFKPQYIFNCAAYKHVPLMQYTPREAINTNVVGNYNLVHTASTWECVEKFVFISSDKAVSSNSVMGASKKMSEVVTCGQGKGYLAVRFGNVLGSRGSLLTIWTRQIDNGEPITITDPRMERYFMSIEDAVGLVIKAAELGKGGEVFCLDMGKKVNIMELASRLIEELKEGELAITGIRPGETLTETLMTEEEAARAERIDNFYVIR